MSLDSHVLAIEVACSPADAFDTYVSRIGTWWPPTYTASPDGLETVVIEPGLGGRVYERHLDGTVIEWGEVTAWAPGAEVAYTSTLAQTKDFPSLVTVRFTAAGSGCRVDFEHGGWNDGNASFRDKFGDWAVILRAYAATAGG
jgi:hypothetical protein